MDLSVNEYAEYSVNKDGDSKSVMLKEPEPDIPVSTYKFRLEWAVFLIYFANTLSATIFQDQVLHQACTAVFRYNVSLCADLGTNSANDNSTVDQIENTVQPFASKIFMAESLVQAIIPAFLALFIGAWSDKYGRKPIILSTTIGYFCFYVIKTIIAAVSIKNEIDPWFYIIASIPVSLSGGSCLMASAIYCYVADLTNFRERPYRMCLMGGVIAIGEVLGQVISSYLYNASNASVVFAVSAASVLIAIIFVMFKIDESVKQEQLVKSSKIQGLFDRQLLKDMIRTVFQKRQHYDRSIIWCIVFSLTIITFDQTGKSTLMFLFISRRLSWSIQTYTLFSGIQVAMYFVGAVAGIMTLQRWLGFKLTTMTLIAFGCAIIQAVFYAAVTAPWYLYVGTVLSFLVGVDTPMCQAMLANVVPLSEIGKLFSLTTALQVIAPLISSPLYTLLYNSTLSTYPGAFNLIGVLLYALSFISIGFVHLVEMRYPNVNRAKAN